MSASFRITRHTAQTDTYATGGVMSVERHDEELMVHRRSLRCRAFIQPPLSNL